MPISACKTRHRTVSAGGLNLFIREAGEPTQPAVLLLHGVPTSSHTFRNLLPLLADTVHAVAPDMPGFGFSDAPPLDRYEYTFENIANTFHALTDEPGLECWHFDWERMSRPGNVEIQFKLFEDYKNFVVLFPEIARYHRAHQPPCLIIWGRHDPYYELQEIMAYARELDRVEMHVFDGAHLLLETHYRECADAIGSFVADVAR